MDYLGFGGSIFNTLFQSGENSTAREYNSAEAQKVRDYNTWLMRNGTQMKVADARSAGLNPAFMNGSQLGSTPTPSGSPESPNTVLPFDTSVGYTNSLLMSQKENVDAQTKNTEEDSRVKALEADRKIIENKYLPLLSQKNISLLDGQIELTGENINYTKEQQKNLAQQTLNLRKQLDEINAKIDNLNAVTSNVEADTKIKLIDAFFETSMCKAKIAELSASAHLSETQAKDIIYTQMARLNNLEESSRNFAAQADKTNAEYDGIRISNGRLQVQFDLDKDYANTERKMDLYSQQKYQKVIQY